ncbi:MAG: hypothetical protein H6Q12_611 [Bacteroidetes bacterium]|nr:hypothetical protein [Bacteroidota bacterium]
MTTEKLIITEGIEAKNVSISLNLNEKALYVRGIQNFTLASGKVVQPALNDTEIGAIRVKDLTMQLENASAEKKPALESKIAAAETCINAVALAVQNYLQTEFVINNPEISEV